MPESADSTIAAASHAGKKCIPDSCAHSAVVDVPTHPTFVKSDDLRVHLSVPRLPRLQLRSALGVDQDPGWQAKKSYRINLPFQDIFVHFFRYEVGVPPDLRVVLELREIQGNTAVFVNAQRRAGPS